MPSLKRSLSVGVLPVVKSGGKRRRKQKPKPGQQSNTSQNATNDSVCGMYDDVIDSVISQQPDDDDDDQVGDTDVDTDVTSLKSEVVQLRAVVERLKTQVDFLLSYVGITESVCAGPSSSTTPVSSMINSQPQLQPTNVNTNL